MANLQTDPQLVIDRLGDQIGGLVTQLAVQGAQLEAAVARVNELEAQLAPKDEENTTEEKEVSSGADTSRARGART